MRKFIQKIANTLLFYNSPYKHLINKESVKYDPSTKSYIKNIFGNSFYLNPKDTGLSKYLALHDIREKESTEMMQKCLKKDMTVLDIGANIGYYVLLEANTIRNGVGKIIAVEPYPDNVKFLRLNVEKNNYQDFVDIIEGAVSDMNGVVELAINSKGNCHKLNSLSQYPANKIMKVKAYTLKETLNLSGINEKEIDFIRMDVEGAEYLILPTIYDLLSEIHDIYMFIEFHPTNVNLELHKNVISKLEQIGFKVIDTTKEYVENGIVIRKHMPNATINELYTNDFYMQFGGCETFLYKS